MPDNSKKSDEKEKPRIGLMRFLQISPRFQTGESKDKGIIALLHSHYRNDIKTAEQWESTVTSLLGKKV